MSIYLQYWGLHEKPFEHASNHRFFYASPEHSEALSRLAYAVSERKPLALLSGEYGTGKTMICHALEGSLSANEHKLIYIPNPLLSATDMLSDILRSAMEIVEVPASKGEVLRLLREVLIRHQDVGKHTSVIVDEAHLIEDMSVFDELRMLLNYQYRERLLLSFIFAGQSDLRDKVGRLPALRQRIAVQFHLKPIPEGEIGNYVRYRLKMAGSRTPHEVFDESCFSSIYKHSKGFPRIINNICDLALLNGFQREMPTVNQEILGEVFQEIPSHEEATAAF